ncbi:transposase [Paenibacillus sp. S150]|uniref:transposase n=1 Tax=Paenibacillus sp. S150 TaxID=2749826 RepID=UPI0021074AF7|nr:transposase [Paenibacillus sp. S150]
MEQAAQGANGAWVQALQGLRGVAFVTAVSLVAEIGSFRRFRSPMQLMAYLGLVPREYSSGQSVRRGKRTKTGNRHARRLLVEAAWSCRHKPAVRGEIAKRQEEWSPQIQRISCKAQERLHTKYRKLVQRGKAKNLAVAAVARELCGFVWAVACEVETGAK